MLASRYQNRRKTTFKKIIKPLNKTVPKIAGYLEIGEYSKKLKPLEHLKIMVHHAIEDKETLTELSLSTKDKIAKERRLVEISKAQLSTVHSNWDYRMYVWILYELVYQAIRKYHALDRVRKGLGLLGIDSAFIILKRAFSRPGYCALTKKIEEGIKIHLGALLGWLTIPITVMVTPGNVSDSPLFEYVLDDMSTFVDLRRVILVFDKAYWKYKRFKMLIERGIKFIVPLKKGARYIVLFERKTKKWIDQTISIGGMKLRLVIIHTEDNDLQYLTNIFDLKPMKIKDCYEDRWDMEILIKEVKQHLEIKRFIGRDLNAVLIQIFCTMIAYLLMALYKIEGNLLISILELKREIRYGENINSVSLNNLPEYALNLI